MNKKIMVKRILQGIAACYGILGVGLIVGGILFIIPAATENMGSATALLILPFLIPGIFMLLAAYQNLRKFGENSIRSLSAIIAFTVFTLVLWWFEPLIKNLSSEFRSKPHYVLLFFVPWIIAFIVYSILSRKLIQVTKDQKIATQQSAPGDGENTAAPEP